MHRSQLGRITLSTAAVLALVAGGCGHDATDPPAVARVDVSPSQDTLLVGDTDQFNAAVYDGSGNRLDGHAVTWQSSNDSVAAVNTVGLVTAVAPGAATITATSESRSGSAAVTVVPVPVATVTLSPDSMSIMVGKSDQFTATTKAADGSVLTGRDVAWESSDTSVATVFASGLVTGVAEGTATITATSEGQSASAVVAVTPEPVASVDVTPDSASVLVSLHTRFGAIPKAADGSWLTDREVVWTSGDTTVATIDSTGLATGVSPGTVTITATSEGQSGSATLTVQAVWWTQVTAGSSHTCSLTITGEMYCWGDGMHGQLGDSSTNNQTAPVAVAGGRAWLSFDAGSSHTCGVTDGGGTAYCWGYGLWGQLGNGTQPSTQATPVPVSGGNTWFQVSGGGNHTCAITSSNDAYCWGANRYGQLGNGDTISQSMPVPVSGGHKWNAVWAGTLHTCGLTTTGEAYCWGYNDNGELGDSTTVSRATPVAVRGGHTWVQLSAGNVHTCGLTDAGEAYCWGLGFDGELGDGTSGAAAQRLVPTAVLGGHTWTNISAAEFFTCAVTPDRTAYCWGANGSGQLGDGTTTSRSTPTPVAGGLSFFTVAGGGLHACGVATTNDLYCWGANGSGQLGDGTNDDHLTPVKVVGP